MATRIPDTVGARLEYLRELAEISGHELDDLAQITKGHARLIETGRVTKATPQILTALADTLGSSLDWLVNGRGPCPQVTSVRAAVEAARRAGESARRKTGTHG